MRRKFSKEVKIQAVKLIVADDVSVKQLSKELEVSQNTLYRWVREHEKYGVKAFPGKGSRAFIYQNELKQLEKENKRLQEELSVLKKFQVLLKKGQK
jgi:transposase